MKKTILVCLIPVVIIFISCGSPSGGGGGGDEDPPNVNWDLRFGQDTSADSILDMANDSQGNLIAVGYGTHLVTADSEKDWWILKIDRFGNLLWQKSFDTSRYAFGRDDEANAVAVDSNDNIYVGGYSNYISSPNSAQDWWIKKFDKNGNEDTTNWNKAISKSTSTSNDELQDIAIDSNDNVYCVGSIKSDLNSTTDWHIRKFDSQGNELDFNPGEPTTDSLTIDGNNQSDVAYAIVIQGTSVYVGGTGNDIVGAGIQADWWIKKFDLDGNEQDFNPSASETDFKMDGGNNLWDTLHDLAVDSLGNVYAAGIGKNLGGSTQDDWWVYKLDSDGAALDFSPDDATNDYKVATLKHEGLFSICIDDDALVYLGGYTVDASDDYQWSLEVFDEFGQKDNGKSQNFTSGSNHYNEIKSMTVDKFGDLYISGYGYDNGSGDNSDIWIKKIVAD